MGDEDEEKEEEAGLSFSFFLSLSVLYWVCCLHSTGTVDFISFNSVKFLSKFEIKAVAKGKAEDFACDTLAIAAERTDEEIFNGVAAVEVNASDNAEVETDEGDTVFNKIFEDASVALSTASSCCLLLI